MYTIPSTMAEGVLIIFNAGRCRVERMLLMTPVFSSSVCHARVRSRKFIHMGRIKINTRNEFWLTFMLHRIMARGYARSRQITVLITDNFSASHRALECSAVAIAEYYPA